MVIPIPFEESQRLAALYGYDILDSPAEPAFDHITRLAAERFAVPTALISFVDPLRQWFKSRVGLAVSETPREISFCGHAILQNDVMQVADATQDPRFADNPLVTEPPHIRFYAGAPLITPGGLRLGSLCLIDYRPRPCLSEAEQEVLAGLAAMVIDQLELRRLRRQALPLPQNHHSTAPEGTTPEELALPVDVLGLEAQRDLLASLSHELRTPLTAILGFADCLRHEVFGRLDNARYLDYAGLIHESGEHMLSLVNRVLDHAKARQGVIVPEEDWLDVPSEIRRCLRMFAEQARQSQIALDAKLTGDLPLLLADRQQLLQMLTNLIGNALKFTLPEGAVRVAAEVLADGRLSLAVADTGIGIARDKLGEILIPFVQIENSLEQRHQGTGLGLPLTKRLIERHGGAFEIDSSEGAGTAVTLLFPHFRLGTAACVETAESDQAVAVSDGGA